MSIHPDPEKEYPLGLSEFKTFYFPASMREELEKQGFPKKGMTVIYYEMRIVEVVKY